MGRELKRVPLDFKWPECVVFEYSPIEGNAGYYRRDVIGRSSLFRTASELFTMFLNREQ